MLSNHVITYDELADLLNEIDKARSLIYQTDKKEFSARLEGRVAKEFYQGVKFLEEEKKLPTNLKELNDFFVAFKSYLRNLEQINLELAFEPSRDFLAKISSWFATTFGKKIILRIDVRPEIIAGVRIEYKGRYQDYSLSKAIDDYFQTIPDLAKI